MVINNNWVSYKILNDSKTIDKEKANRVARIILIIFLALLLFFIGLIMGLNIN